MSTETQTAEVVAEETKEAAAAETTEQKPWYQGYGYESEDTFKADFEILRGYKEKAEHLTKEEQRILDLAASAEKPWHSETFARMDAFAKKTGIEDARIISDVMSSTKEDLINNPLEALCLQMAATNPEKYKALGGRSGVMEMLREDYNLPSEGDYTATKKLTADAFDAVSALEKIKSDVGEVQNPYNIAQERSNKAQAEFQQKQTLALAELEEVTGEITEVSIKDGDGSVSFKVTKEEIAKVFETQKDYLGAAFDMSTNEGKQAFRDYAKDQVLYSKVKSGEFLTEWKKTYAADVARAATGEVLNGKVKSIDRAETATPGKKETPAEKYARENNIPIPAEHRNLQPQKT